jgi:hypothetical protein
MIDIREQAPMTISVEDCLAIYGLNRMSAALQIVIVSLLATASSAKWITNKGG